MNETPLLAMMLGWAALLASGCVGGQGLPPVEYAPPFNPADFVAGVSHPFYPLAPGTRWVFHGPGSASEREVTTLLVTNDTKTILGIRATVVRDTVAVDGALVEDTRDWFAQDRAGNVWYLGEESREYEGGRFVGLEGSWQAGVDGAEAGVIMPATPDPAAGAYRQEWYAGEAEDMGMVVATDARVEVPFGTYDGVVQVREWDPLESSRPEGSKYFARGLGMVLEEEGDERVELVSYTRGGGA